MKAGRELDLLVAKHVMGYFKIKSLIPDEPNKVFYPELQMKDGELVPHYSTDIKDAWEIVEKLRKDWTMEIRQVRNGTLDVTFYNYDAKHKSRNIDTAPLAICLAALKAKGVENERQMEKEDN
jgi:hypothetical protein